MREKSKNGGGGIGAKSNGQVVRVCSRDQMTLAALVPDKEKRGRQRESERESSPDGTEVK